MSSTYRAFEVTGQRQFKLVERQRREPLPGEVRLRVQACGVCHSDVLAVEGMRADPSKPVVPGHEVAGVVEAVGPGVTAWHEGDRVGVGYLNGHCGECESCRRGDFVNCSNQEQTGTTVDGGYAEVAYARASGLVRLPDDVDPADLGAAAVRGADGVQRVAAGHCRRAARGAGGHPGNWWAGSPRHPIRHQARLPGRGHHPGRRKGEAGTATRRRPLHRQRHHRSRGRAAGTRRGGGHHRDRLQRRIDVAADCRPGPAGKADGGGRRPRTHRGQHRRHHLRHSLPLVGSLTGSSIENEDNLQLAQRRGIRSMNEVMPFTEAPKAYERMMSGKARFRVVLDIGR